MCLFRWKNDLLTSLLILLPSSKRVIHEMCTGKANREKTVQKLQRICLSLHTREIYLIVSRKVVFYEIFVAKVHFLKISC